MVRTTVGKDPESGGDVKMEFQRTEKFTAETPGEVLELVIRHGRLSIRGLAQTVRAELAARGYDVSEHGKYSNSHFSEMVNMADSALYEAADLIDIICRAQGDTWLLEYLAAGLDCVVIPARTNGGGDDAADDSSNIHDIRTEERVR